jgi:hypothetical protein
MIPLIRYSDSDGTIFPERDTLIEYPLVDREETIFSFFTQKYLLRLCEPESLPCSPSDIIEPLPIIVITQFSYSTLARKHMIYIYTHTDECEDASYDTGHNMIDHHTIVLSKIDTESMEMHDFCNEKTTEEYEKISVH